MSEKSSSTKRGVEFPNSLLKQIEHKRVDLDIEMKEAVREAFEAWVVISARQRAQLQQLAADRKTTVGILISDAVREFLQETRGKHPQSAIQFSLSPDLES